RAMAATDAGGRWIRIVSFVLKQQPLAIDRAGTFDGDIVGVDRVDEADVAVVGRGIAVEWYGVDVMVLLAVAGAEQRAAGGNVQGDVALQLDHADLEDAARDEHGAAAIFETGIDCRLDRKST